MVLLPIELIQAFIALGGVCIVACPEVFYYLKIKVDECVSARVQKYFSSPTSSSFNNALTAGTLPLPIVKDFSEDLGQILEPNRRFKSVLVLLPIIGSAFIFSAVMAALPLFVDGISVYSTFLEILSDSILVVGFIGFVYSLNNLIKLLQVLA